MTTPRSLLKLPLLLSLALAAIAPIGCDSAKDEKKAEEVKVLPEAKNGSPVSAELIEFTGEGEERGMKVRLYNKGDKTAAGYFLLMRYYEGDKLLKVKEGTPFEKDTDFTSLSGGRYSCEPNKNAVVTLDGRMVGVPAAATRAEILIAKVDAKNGGKIEPWWSQDDWNTWPSDAE